jgi:hypothetical protein
MKSNEQKLNTNFTMDEVDDIIYALSAASNHFESLDYEKVALRFWKLRQRLSLEQIEFEEKNM